MAWHRWFASGQESRATARLITGVSSLAFLFLIVSGAYLWLPRVFRWPLFRQRLRITTRYKNAKDRDFYWHHIFAAWSLLPLIVVVVTAVVISFAWANRLLTAVAGDDTGRSIEVASATIPDGAMRPDLDELLQRVMAQPASWESITLKLPGPRSRTVSIEVDAGSGRQPHMRHTVVLDAYTGEVIGWSGFTDRPAVQRAIAWNRFLHTGETFGFVGQTIAGLASIASLILVWTGFALAWRRLIVPLYGRRK